MRPSHAAARSRQRRWGGSSGSTSVEGGKAKLVVQVNWLRRDGRRATHIHGRTRPYRHGDGETLKLKLGSAFFMAGWGQAARRQEGEGVDRWN